ALLVEQIDCGRSLRSKNSAGEIDKGLFAGKPENVEHIALFDFFSTKRDELIEHRLGITQPAVRAAGNRVRSPRLQSDLFFAGDELQVLRDQIRRNAMQIEPLTPAQDSWQNLLRLGGCENKFHMLGRLFQRLQKRIKRRCREHVHLVNQVDFVTTL